MHIDTETREYRGHKITIKIHRDEHMGPPWQEHDGHGPVRELRDRSEKRPGEIMLTDGGPSWSNASICRAYDYAEAMKIAKRDGWGLLDKQKAELAAKLGRKPTKNEIAHASVMHDFEYLRGWCNDDWQWLGYTSEIKTPDGKTLESDLDSCWGFDDAEYMVREALSNAEHAIDRHIEFTEREAINSHQAACADIATV